MTPSTAPTRRNAATRLLVLTLALGLIALVILALACGPSAPAGQDDVPEEATPTPTHTPTPTPTPSIDCDSPEHEGRAECFGSLPTMSDFQKKYSKYGLSGVMEDYEKAKERAGVSGADGNPAPLPTPHTLEIRIFVDKDARLTELTDLLNRHGITDIDCFERTAGSSPQCIAVAPVSLLKMLADTGWVSKFMQILPATLSSLPNAAPGQTIRDPHGVVNWSSIYNGQRAPNDSSSRIKVGIINGGFTDLRATLPLATIAGAYCRDSQETLQQGSGAVAIAACDHGPDDHGRDVVDNLLDTAPEVALYISNALYKPERFNSRAQDAVKWMLANNVDIINMSINTPVWTGPGDGTSRMPLSLLNLVKSATDRGVLWVNSAGNNATEGWYRNGPDFTSTGWVDFDPSPSRTNDCYPIQSSMQMNRSYAFLVRWNGNWGNASGSDLTLYLRRVSPIPAWVKVENEPQSGGPDYYPYEVLTYKLTLPNGQYCLGVYKPSHTSAPQWLQVRGAGLELRDGGTKLNPVILPSDGTIAEPADSSEPNVLARGAADIDAAGAITLQSFSNRGPLPETSATVPDLVGANVIHDGTSFAAPRVAGLAALVMQQKSPNGTPSPSQRPTLVADTIQYLKDHALPYSESVPAGTPTPTPGPNNEWGHGFAYLPTLTPTPTPQPTLTAPTNVAATAGSGTVAVTWTNGRGAALHLVLLFTSDFSGYVSATATGASHTFTGVAAGNYVAVVVAVDAASNIKYAASGTVTVR